MSLNEKARLKNVFKVRNNIPLEMGFKRFSGLFAVL